MDSPTGDLPQRPNVVQDSDRFHRAMEVMREANGRLRALGMRQDMPRPVYDEIIKILTPVAAFLIAENDLPPRQVRPHTPGFRGVTDEPHDG